MMLKVIMMLVAFRSTSDAIKCYAYRNIKVGSETKVLELEVDDCEQYSGYDRCLFLKGSIIRDGINYEVVDLKGCSEADTCNYLNGIGHDDKEQKRLETLIQLTLGYNKWELGKAELGSTPYSASCCDDKDLCNTAADNSSSGRIYSFMTSFACLAIAIFA